MTEFLWFICFVSFTSTLFSSWRSSSRGYVIIYCHSCTDDCCYGKGNIECVSFFHQCKPDLKVAGLYVVDSIIRQSRHQFGTDKDLFGPRFLKNFTVTFQNLFQCPADDKVLSYYIRIYSEMFLCWWTFCWNVGEDIPCVESVAEEWRVHHGHHSAAVRHGHSSCTPCCGEWSRRRR